MVSGGVRRPGYAADIQAEDLAVELFRDMGLEVHTEPVPVRRWVPERWTLTVTPAGGDPIDLDCTPLPYGADR